MLQKKRVKLFRSSEKRPNAAGRGQEKGRMNAPMLHVVFLCVLAIVPKCLGANITIGGLFPLTSLAGSPDSAGLERFAGDRDIYDNFTDPTSVISFPHGCG